MVCVPDVCISISTPVSTSVPGAVLNEVAYTSYVPSVTALHDTVAPLFVAALYAYFNARSEERRVGKECSR